MTSRLLIGLAVVSACHDNPTARPDASASHAGRDAALRDASQSDARIDAAVECPAGYVELAGACVRAKLVFVSSATYAGDLGGTAGADAICRVLAGAAGLPGTFRAWLSDGEVSAGTRLAHGIEPYALVDGTLVALDWTALTSPPLAHAIDEDETGAPVGARGVWTNTQPDGSLDACDADTCIAGRTCAGFATTVSAYQAPVGDASAVDRTWTIQGLATCATSNSLYCIQQ